MDRRARGHVRDVVAGGLTRFRLIDETMRPLYAMGGQPEGLIDLQLQRELLGEDLVRVREACVEIFAGRDLHPWPPELVVPDDWREPYATAAGELDADLPLDVDSAADQVRDFITAIDVAG